MKLGNIIPTGQKYYDRRKPRGCANTLTAAMGMGGGFIQLLLVIK